MSALNAIKRRLRNYRAKQKARSQSCGFSAVANQLTITTFYDVEGDYAIDGMHKPCFSALEKIATIEQDCGIKSSYNVVAKLALEAPDLFRELEKNGHEISSHSLDHRVLTRLSATERKHSIYEAKKIFDDLGVNVIGHRSPQSSWDFAIVKDLKAAGYQWNAENDKNRVPYMISHAASEDKALWRMPVTMDDWWYEGDGLRPAQVLEQWQSKIIEEQKTGGCISIGFHPWVEYPGERLEAFEEFMRWISQREGVRTMPFKQLLAEATGKC